MKNQRAGGSIERNREEKEEHTLWGAWRVLGSVSINEKVTTLFGWHVSRDFSHEESRRETKRKTERVCVRRGRKEKEKRRPRRERRDPLCSSSKRLSNKWAGPLFYYTDIDKNTK